MITEDYVSFETAKLLKEKGFDEKCFGLYGPEFMEAFFKLDNTQASRSSKESYSAPTLQMTMKWLRETFGIHCQIDCPITPSNWVYSFRDLNKDEWWVTTFGNTDTYDTYEEACEAAIKYCLENLI